jgi:hypothetical protein
VPLSRKTREQTVLCDDVAAAVRLIRKRLTAQREILPMDNSAREENEEFEDEVRRIARQLWPESQFSGATKMEGRERDGIFETEECFHLLEATTSRGMLKAEEDIKKLMGLATTVRKRAGTKAVRCWFVTRDEPTADQRKLSDKHRDVVNALSFAQFQARLINVRAYLTARDNFSFGSVRDPVTGKGPPAVDFIEIRSSMWSCRRISRRSCVFDSWAPPTPCSGRSTSCSYGQAGHEETPSGVCSARSCTIISRPSVSS